MTHQPGRRRHQKRAARAEPLVILVHDHPARAPVREPGQHREPGIGLLERAVGQEPAVGQEQRFPTGRKAQSYGQGTTAADAQQRVHASGETGCAPIALRTLRRRGRQRLGRDALQHATGTGETPSAAHDRARVRLRAAAQAPGTVSEAGLDPRHAGDEDASAVRHVVTHRGELTRRGGVDVQEREQHRLPARGLRAVARQIEVGVAPLFHRHAEAPEGLRQPFGAVRPGQVGGESGVFQIASGRRQHAGDRGEDHRPDRPDDEGLLTASQHGA